MSARNSDQNTPIQKDWLVAVLGGWPVLLVREEYRWTQPTISVTHQQYAIVSDGVLSLYEGDGTTMTTPSRGYLTITPSTEYGPVEVSIDVVFRELDEYVPSGWTLESHGSFEVIAELRVETTDGQVWPQFKSLKGIQYPSDACSEHIGNTRPMNPSSVTGWN